MGVTFRSGVSQTVSKKLYEYLNENPYFVLDKDLKNQKDDPINYTESELKGMNKAQSGKTFTFPTPSTSSAHCL